VRVTGSRPNQDLSGVEIGGLGVWRVSSVVRTHVFTSLSRPVDDSGCVTLPSPFSVAPHRHRTAPSRPTTSVVGWSATQLYRDCRRGRCAAPLSHLDPNVNDGTTDRVPSEGSIVPERPRSIDRSEHEGAGSPVSPASRPPDRTPPADPRTREHAASLFWICLKPERNGTSSNSWRGSARVVRGPRPDPRFRIDMMQTSMTDESRSRCRPRAGAPRIRSRAEHWDRRPGARVRTVTGLSQLTSGFPSEVFTFGVDQPERCVNFSSPSG
jgi:hypothetical protein